jgi:hypothetical protein
MGPRRFSGLSCEAGNTAEPVDAVKDPTRNAAIVGPRWIGCGRAEITLSLAEGCGQQLNSAADNRCGPCGRSVYADDDAFLWIDRLAGGGGGEDGKREVACV